MMRIRLRNLAGAVLGAIVLGLAVLAAPARGAEDEAARKAKVAELIKNLGDADAKVRSQAARSLEDMGPAGKDAVPALIKALDDPEMFVRKDAVNALLRIGAEAKEAVEARRVELRKSAEEALTRDDYSVGRREYLRALAPPEPQLRDARAAMRLFEKREDWPALADAYEAATDAMWRLTHMPAEAFIRPATEAPRAQFGGPRVQVQTGLDGEWSNASGTGKSWIPWIERKQGDLRQERIRLLEKLGLLCLVRLNSPVRAVAAYETAGWEVPLQTEPLEKLIPTMWPQMNVKAVDVLALNAPGGEHIRSEVLDGLSEAQVAAGDLHGAAETRLRAMLAMLMDAKGDWNAWYPMNEAEAFWKIVRRMPPGDPLPPLLWLDVLDREKPERDYPSPDDGRHRYPLSFPGPNLVIRPGQRALRLTVSADMESPGGIGGVRCYTFIDGKVHGLGRVSWYADRRAGREWRTGTFDVPEDAGILQVRIEPEAGKELHVYEIKVNAEFAPEPVPPENQIGR